MPTLDVRPFIPRARHPNVSGAAGVGRITESTR